MRFWRRRTQPDEIVAVFRARDRESLLLARSLLDSAVVRYAIVNDFTQDIIFPGRIGTGFNLATGLPTKWVSRADQSTASDVLAELKSYRPSRVSLWLRVAAACVLFGFVVLVMLTRLRLM